MSIIILMFSSKTINVEFYIKKIEHNLKFSKIFNFKENKNYAQKIYHFVDYYIKNNNIEIHPNKLYYLKKIKDYMLNFIAGCDKETDRKEINNLFLLLIEEFNKFALFGSVYLLRHPDKTKEKGRNLSFLGVKQAKYVAELIKDEILLSPKPVKIEIYTSEIKRTEIFAKIINHINKAEKIGKNVEFYQKEDERLFMGPLSQGVFDLYEKAIKEHGDKADLVCFKNWLNREKGFDKEIQEKGINDPITVREAIIDFVNFAQERASDQDYYTIVIGIGHSWMLDTWLYHYTGIEDIISTAEYVKVEFNELYYKKNWVSL